MALITVTTGINSHSQAALVAVTKGNSMYPKGTEKIIQSYAKRNGIPLLGIVYKEKAG